MSETELNYLAYRAHDFTPPLDGLLCQEVSVTTPIRLKWLLPSELDQ